MNEFRHSDTLGQLAKAKAIAQAKFMPIGKDKTANAGKYSYAYAGLDTCLEAVIPALSEVGIAVFQPTRIEAGQAIASTLLVHESGEFLSGDYAVTINDPADAQSIGSATTYARRYGLLAMLACAAGAEDDDGQAARGGDHPMATPASAPPCPACGVVGSLMKSSAQYGGGWVCWQKRGGCGQKWPEGTPYPPTTKPKVAKPARVGVVDYAVSSQPAPEPACPACGVVGALTKIRPDRGGGILDWQKRGGCGQTWPEGTPFPPTSVSGSTPADASWEPAAQEARAAGITATHAGMGAEDCLEPGCWGGRGHSGAHMFDTDAEALKTMPAMIQPEEAAITTFKPFGGKTEITTAGMTLAQFEESHRLAQALDKKFGKATARGILADMLGVEVEAATRKDLTEARAEEYLTLLRQAAEAVAP